ncbi:MAG: hypothetical protein LBI74_08605 [Synergistaceae bacterium]|jgi:hypothetical protein|nr:hypothetical protein [Synergistaceae bacterium]
MARKENREFVGVMPKNKFIMDKVRKEGWFGVMFNKSDFLDAVMWAANTIYSYKDFYSPHKERMVIPIDDLPFWKQDLINAHMIMINYYKVKGNTEQLDMIKRSLMTVAKFQKVLEDDIETMKDWDEYLIDSNHTMDMSVFGRHDMGKLRGKGGKYEHYSKMVSSEIEKYNEELSKSKL